MSNPTQRNRSEQDFSSVVTARRLNERLQSDSLPTGGLFLDRLCRGVVVALASNGTDYRVNLPSATTLENGWSVKIISDKLSDVVLNVNNANQDPLIGLYAGEILEFTLIDNSTPQGSWLTIAHDQGNDPEIIALPCDASCFVGAIVYMDTSGTVFPSKSSTLVEADAIGVVLRFAQPGYAFIAQQGAVDVSALYGTVDVGKSYYLSNIAGRISTIPYSAGSNTWYKRVGKGIDSKRVMFEFGSPKIFLES